jgi:DNA-binding GntR family transcriptional regulator
MKLQPIANLTLKDHVYDALRTAITGMDIYGPEADLRLDERSLAEQLGISRTPLRSAIARLEQDGLVSVVPRRGVFVQRKSLGEILEMIVAWAALESMAARLAADRASDAEIASLRRIAAEYPRPDAALRVPEYSGANILFHQTILEISGCRLLRRMAEGLFLHMNAVRLRAMGEGDRVSRSIDDHGGIIDALVRRDADGAARRVREHTMRLHNHVRDAWTEFGLARPNDAAADATPRWNGA